MFTDTVLWSWTETSNSRLSPNKLPFPTFWEERMFSNVSKKACLISKVLTKSDRKWLSSDFWKTLRLLPWDKTNGISGPTFFWFKRKSHMKTRLDSLITGVKFEGSLNWSHRRITKTRQSQRSRKRTQSKTDKFTWTWTTTNSILWVLFRPTKFKTKTTLTTTSWKVTCAN